MVDSPMTLLYMDLKSSVLVLVVVETIDVIPLTSSKALKAILTLLRPDK